MEKKHSIGQITLLIAVALLTVSLIAFLIFFGRAEPKIKSRTYYGYFDTVTTVYDYSGSSEEAFSDNCRLASEILDYYHKLFDIYNEYEGITNLATVNRLAGEGEVEVTAELLDFLQYSVQMYNLTGGEVNVAMGAVLSMWHDFRAAAGEGAITASVPTDQALLSASKHCDITKMVINRERGTVELIDPEMSLDVGAIAKGYAVERVAEALEEAGYCGYVLDVGGNLRAIGTKPDGEGWRTGVKNPDASAEEAYVCTFDIADTSVVTSGNYERYVIFDGEKYHHIIDKDTLKPAAHFASVTVVCKNSGLADALSTALFNMDYETGRALVDTLDGVRVLWVYSDGESVGNL